jgi:hypothetical protein
MAKKPSHAGGRWKPPSDGTTFGKVNPTSNARAGTGTGNKAPLVDQARQSMREFDAQDKQAKRAKRGRLG